MDYDLTDSPGPGRADALHPPLVGSKEWVVGQHRCGHPIAAHHSGVDEPIRLGKGNGRLRLQTGNRRHLRAIRHA